MPEVTPLTELIIFLETYACTLRSFQTHLRLSKPLCAVFKLSLFLIWLLSGLLDQGFYMSFGIEGLFYLDYKSLRTHIFIIPWPYTYFSRSSALFLMTDTVFRLSWVVSRIYLQEFVQCIPQTYESKRKVSTWDFSSPQRNDSLIRHSWLGGCW